MALLVIQVMGRSTEKPTKKPKKSSSESKKSTESNMVDDLNQCGACCACDCSAPLADVTEQPKTCCELMEMGFNNSGVYTIYVGPFNEPVEVFCDQETDGGGWMVFQRRVDGSVDFYQNWDAYSQGFGNLYGEFWLGNRLLHLVTDQAENELRIDMEDFEGEQAVAQYDSFHVGSPLSKYRLTLGDYQGGDVPGDSFSVHDGMQFSTYDQDNDNKGSDNCAVTYKGAFWYMTCHGVNINGAYLANPMTTYADGIIWKTWKGFSYSLKATEAKIRPVAGCGGVEPEDELN